MIRFAIALIAAAATGLSAAAASAPRAGRDQAARATLHGVQGRRAGEGLAARHGRVVRISLTVRGFRPGVYGVHLHQTGRCDAPDFASAGPHWNPDARQHGRLNPRGPHLGDLPNLRIGRNGTGRLAFTLPVPAGTARGANPLLDADGTAIVVHAAADDGRTDPSGNSGVRIACGVFAVR